MSQVSADCRAVAGSIYKRETIEFVMHIGGASLAGAVRRPLRQVLESLSNDLSPLLSSTSSSTIPTAA